MPATRTSTTSPAKAETTFSAAAAASTWSCSAVGSRPTWRPVRRRGRAGDRLLQVEGLSGSLSQPHDDVFIGDGGANYLSGGAGADTLSGGDGNGPGVRGRRERPHRRRERKRHARRRRGGDVVAAGPGVLDAALDLNAPGAVDVNLATQRASGDGVDTLYGARGRVRLPVSGSAHGRSAAQRALRQRRQRRRRRRRELRLSRGRRRARLAGRQRRQRLLPFGCPDAGVRVDQVPGAVPSRQRTPPIRRRPDRGVGRRSSARRLELHGATTLDRAVGDSVGRRLEAVRRLARRSVTAAPAPPPRARGTGAATRLHSPQLRPQGSPPRSRRRR